LQTEKENASFELAFFVVISIILVLPLNVLMNMKMFLSLEVILFKKSLATYNQNLFISFNLKNLNMIKKYLYLLITLIIASCSKSIDKKEVISKISKDNLVIKRVDVIQESNYYNVITDIENSVNTSKEAWKNAPELNKLHRLIIIDEVSKKFLKKLKEGKYANDDKVIAYQFTKMDKSKKFIGYAVILFHEQNQHTLFYEIYPAPYDYFPRGGVKQLINKGLVEEINRIETEYNKNHPVKS
jgi:hypothetical protein